MQVVFIDRDPELIRQLREAGPEFLSECGDILEYPCEALVSPANSFGFMDGGIDLAYSTRFGWALQDQVQAKIKAEFNGELLVGQALAVALDSENFPRLIVAPTMRVPTHILDPNAVRLATKAAVRLAKDLRLQSIVLPGMGTGTGRVKQDWAARMMIAGAIDGMGPRMFPKSIQAAADDHFKTSVR